MASVNKAFYIEVDAISAERDQGRWLHSRKQAKHLLRLSNQPLQLLKTELLFTDDLECVYPKIFRKIERIPGNLNSK